MKTEKKKLLKYLFITSGGDKVIKIKQIVISILLITILSNLANIFYIPTYAATNNGVENSTSSNNSSTSNRKPDWTETILAMTVSGLALGIQEGLDSVGIGLDQMLLGKDTNGKESILKFSLTDPNNPFGTIAVSLYWVCYAVAVCAFCIICPTIFIRLITASNSNALADTKKLLITFCISFLLMFVMPLFIHTFMQVRDGVIETIISSFTTTGKLSIIEEFRTKAFNVGKTTLFDSLLYLGVNLITLWFAFAYAGITMSITVLVGLFPWISVTMNSSKAKRTMEKWIEYIISIGLVPVIDTVLMCIAIIGINKGFKPLITLIILALIIPTRTFIRQVLGVGGGALEASGLGFFMGGAMLARGLSGAAGAAYTGIQSGSDDLRRADYYKDLAAVDANGGNYAHSLSGMADGVAGAPGISSAVSYKSFMSEEEAAFSTKDSWGNSTSPMAPRSTTEYATGRRGATIETEDGDTKYIPPSTYADVYDKHKNISWLNNSEMMNNLSNADKAELYSVRGNTSIKKAIAGGLGAGAGILGGATVGSFLGSSAMMAGAGMGAEAGTKAFTVAADHIIQPQYLHTKPSAEKSEGTGLTGAEGATRLEVSGGDLAEEKGVASPESSVAGSLDIDTSGAGDVISIDDASTSEISSKVDLSIDTPQIREIINNVTGNPEINAKANEVGSIAARDFRDRERQMFIDNKLEEYALEHGDTPIDKSSIDYKSIMAEADDYSENILAEKAMTEYLIASNNYRKESVKTSIEDSYGDIVRGTDLEVEIDKEIERSIKDMVG